MDKKIVKLGLLAAIVAVILIISFTATKNITKIDTEEKAIAYAKTDPDVNTFVNKWENGVEFWAYKNDSNWKVEIVPVRTADIAFGILFNQDRTIISKGIEGGM